MKAFAIVCSILLVGLMGCGEDESGGAGGSPSGSPGAGHVPDMSPPGSPGLEEARAKALKAIEEMKKRDAERAGREPSPDDAAAPGAGLARLDPKVLLGLLDVLPEYRAATEAVDQKALAAIAKKLGVPHYAALGSYYLAISTVATVLNDSPDASLDDMERVYGKEALRLLSEPANLEKAKAGLGF